MANVLYPRSSRLSVKLSRRRIGIGRVMVTGVSLLVLHGIPPLVMRLSREQSDLTTVRLFWFLAVQSMAMFVDIPRIAYIGLIDETN